MNWCFSSSFEKLICFSFKLLFVRFFLFYEIYFYMKMSWHLCNIFCRLEKDLQHLLCIHVLLIWEYLRLYYALILRLALLIRSWKLQCETKRRYMGVIRTYHKDLDMLLNNDTKTTEDDRHQQNIDEQRVAWKMWLHSIFYKTFGHLWVDHQAWIFTCYNLCH